MTLRRPLLSLLVAGMVVSSGGSKEILAATGMSFLQIGAGGRAAALGNAVVSNVADASATYWNPGALCLGQGTFAEVSHNESLHGVRYEFLSLAHQRGRQGIGAAFHGLWTDALKGYNEAGEYQGEFAYYDMALSLSYAYALSDQFGLGASVEYVREQIDVYNAGGFAFGLGAQVRDLLPRTSLGLSVRHLGSEMKFERVPFDLPMTIQGGVSHRIPLGILHGQILLAAELEKVRDQNARVVLGSEYRYQDLARLQFGYRSGLDTQDISMGVGVGNGKLVGQYSYSPFGENLGSQQRFSVTYAF